MSKITNLEHLKKLAQRTQTEVAAVDQKISAIKLPTKVSELNNDSGYQTEAEVAEAIKDKADKGTTLASYGIADAYTRDRKAGGPQRSPGRTGPPNQRNPGGDQARYCRGTERAERLHL